MSEYSGKLMNLIGAMLPFSAKHLINCLFSIFPACFPLSLFICSQDFDDELQVKEMEELIAGGGINVFICYLQAQACEK